MPDTEYLHFISINDITEHIGALSELDEKFAAAFIINAGASSREAL